MSLFALRSGFRRWAVALFVAAIPGLAAATEDPVVYATPNDEDIARATEDAQATLGNVLERAATGGIPMEALQLKVAIPRDHVQREDGETLHERLWVQGIVRLDETTLEGLLANDPHDLPDMKRGDRHRFTIDEIVDWLFVVNGKMHGAYSLRVMLPVLPKEQADAFRAMLAPLP